MTNLNPTTSTAAQIATQLGETERGPRATIWRTVRTIGPERAHAFVAQAQEAEANGGMMVPDGSRRRTLGGIFFYLVRTHISDDEAMQINRAWCTAYVPRDSSSLVSSYTWTYRCIGVMFSEEVRYGSAVAGRSVHVAQAHADPAPVDPA